MAEASASNFVGSPVASPYHHRGGALQPLVRGVPQQCNPPGGHQPHPSASAALAAHPAPAAMCGARDHVLLRIVDGRRRGAGRAATRLHMAVSCWGGVRKCPAHLEQTHT
eukprot:scaffold170995_cov46-Prasinocladus_malaysianus.AAC.1